VVLRAFGVLDVCAAGAVVMPVRWMAAAHAWLGLGVMPDGPLVGYLARSAAALYVLHGAMVLFLSLDVRRYWRLITFLAVAAVLHGAVMLGIDLAEGMPFWWTAFEGAGFAATGPSCWRLRRQVAYKGRKRTWFTHSAASLADQISTRSLMIAAMGERCWTNSRSGKGLPAPRRAPAASGVVLTSWDRTIRPSAAAYSSTSSSGRCSRPTSFSSSEIRPGERAGEEVEARQNGFENAGRTSDRLVSQPERFAGAGPGGEGGQEAQARAAAEEGDRAIGEQEVAAPGGGACSPGCPPVPGGHAPCSPS
jgi:hypothetical protein